MRRLTTIIILLTLPVVALGSCPQGGLIDSLYRENTQSSLFSLKSNLANCDIKRDTLALCLHAIGVNYFKEDNLDSAIVYTSQAIDVRKGLSQNELTEDWGKSHHNLGVFYSRSVQWKQAIEQWKSAVDIFQSLDHHRVSRSYLELGKAYFEKGEYEVADKYYNLAITNARKYNDPARLAKASMDLGRLRNEQGESKLAIEVLHQAIIQFDNDQNDYDKAGCHNMIGIAYQKLNDFENAKNNYKIAANLFAGIDENEHCKVINNWALLSITERNYAKANQLLSKGQNLAIQIGNQELIAQSHDHWSDFYRHQGMLKLALNSSQLSIANLCPYFIPKDDLDNPSLMSVTRSNNKLDLLIYIANKSNILADIYKRTNDDIYKESAINVCRLGDKLIDQIRYEHIDFTTKLFWRNNTTEFFENAIQICELSNDVDNGLYFIERSKSIMLLDRLHLIDYLNEFNSEQISVFNELRSSVSSDLERLSTESKSIDDDLVRRVIENQNAINELWNNAVGVQSVQTQYERLFAEPNNGEFHMHYFWGSDNVYAVGIGNSKKSIRTVGSSEILESEILSIIRSTINKENWLDIIGVDSLCNKLLELSLSTTTSDLVIYPDGLLSFLPFDVLLGKDQKSDLQINNINVRYDYSKSISDVRNNTPINKIKKSGLIAFAPFAIKGSESSESHLEYSSDELSGISKVISGSYFLGSDATFAKFEKGIQGSSVVHLSTHANGRANDQEPYILFADTLLTLNKLYGLATNVDLIVLSACESNLGKNAVGEGVLSLGRGFVYAGAKSMISSLWKVNAASTGMIFTEFYKNVLDGLPKHVALSEAKRSYLNNPDIPTYLKTPYYWAGLVYYGDDSALQIRPARDWINTYMMAGCLALFGIGCYSFSRQYI